MVKRDRRFFTAIASLLFFCVCFSALPTLVFAEEGTTQRRILYISSYSFSWGSVPYQMQGLSEGLGSGYVINYEFMDTKNTVYSEGYREFYDLLRYKLSTREPYDAVVVCDDAALNFVQLYKDELFPDLPIVFSGIDNVQSGKIAAEDKNITGIVEVVDYAANMRLAHTLLPNAQKLVLILDNMENGIGIAEQLKASSHVFSDYEVEYLNSAEYTEEEFKTRLSALNHTEIVFCISMGQRQGGLVYSEEERYELIRNYVNVPMFRFTQSGIGEGLLGGYIVDHTESCRIAGHMLKQMLETGTESEINLNTPCAYCFDYQVMEKFDIKLSQLPASVREHCIMINEPKGFLEANVILIVSVLFGMLALILLYALLNRYMNMKKLAGKNRELEIAVNEADQASKAKSQFLARVSHDMRTPMNTIINLTEMVEEEIDNKDAAISDLRHIKTSNQFLLGLINDVLDMSRIESGKLELHPERYSYSEFLEYMHCNFDLLATQRNIELNITPGTEYVDIMIDKVRFNQVCFNLVSNALKYTEPGGHVNFLMRHGEAHDGILPCEIIVSDDGIGISEKFQENIFVAFEQEGRSYKTVEGMGLGLSIVKSILDAMDGTISFHSKKNEGTTFLIHLDMVLADTSAETEKSVAFDSSTLRGKRILIAEDHPMNQQIAKRLLAKVGAEVYITENGKQAVEAFASGKNHFDAILMDIRMPIMDGLEATGRIRAMNRSGADSIPIIAMTANAYDDDVRRSLEAGMNMHLGKPVEPHKLYESLILMLEENQK